MQADSLANFGARGTRLAGIEALRGIAASLVVCQHASEILGSSPVVTGGRGISSIVNFLDFGRIGVICFFLISGYVIPFSLRQEEQGAILKFAVKRFFRLYPAYWLSLIVGTALANVVLADADGVGWGQFLANLTMLQTYLGFQHVVGLYWTLQTELVFYFAAAGLFAVQWLRRADRIVLCICVFVAVFVLVQGGQKLLAFDVAKEHGYAPFLLAVMLSGTLLRLSTEGAHTSGLRRYYVPIALLAVFGIPAGVLTLGLFGIEVVKGPITFGASHLLGLCLFGAGLVWSRPPKVAVWLGTVSYSLYLFHPLVIQLLRLAVESTLDDTGGVPFGLVVCVAFGLSVLFAWVIYTVVERPSIELGRIVTRKLSVRA